MDIWILLLRYYDQLLLKNKRSGGREMSSNNRQYSFEELLLEHGRVRIPRIQRDYAQGRRNKAVTEIRKVFVHSLISVLKDNNSPKLELDFIYGCRKDDGAFEPLDGQQRLTTLFLLHWMVGVNYLVFTDNNGLKRSRFTYETRVTSTEFCDELVQHNAWSYIKKALDSKNKSNIPISFIISGLDWFKWSWRHDPTIQSMLVMIDAIFGEVGMDNWKEESLNVYQQKLSNITFNLLELKDFSMSDQLYVKMNARGKQLSDFDKVKSTLEEELQLQKCDKSEDGTIRDADEIGEIERTWRSLMDGAWIDFFWQKFGVGENKSGEDIKKEDAILAEKKFKVLLLRLIAIQLFERDSDEELVKVAYNMNEDALGDLLYTYTNRLRKLRSNQDDQTIASVAINFKQLIMDVNLLINNFDGRKYEAVSDLIGEDAYVDKEPEGKSVFYTFIKEYLPNHEVVIFYAFLSYLREFAPMRDRWNSPYVQQSFSEVWLSNLEDWTIVMRNILHNDNNNRRIDKLEVSKLAFRGVKDFLSDLRKYVNDKKLSVENDKGVVIHFLCSPEEEYQGLDNASLKEEREKAKLIKADENWKDLIRSAERHKYLWGQVRCLLEWSDNNQESFKNYRQRLEKFLAFMSDSKTSNDGYFALLSVYPYYWRLSNRLYVYNKDRDNSFKRYLRSKEGKDENQGDYGAAIKSLLDRWKDSFGGNDFASFVKKMLESHRDLDPWLWCMLHNKSILDYSSYKRIYEDKGHVVLPELKTLNSRCKDPILLCLHDVVKSKDPDGVFYDSKSDGYQHRVEWKEEDVTHYVQWSMTDRGEYVCSIDSNAENVISPNDLMEKLKPYLIDCR